VEKRLISPSSRIQKTTILFVIALAALGAVGVTATMITAATTADAAPRCIFGSHVAVCPPGSYGDPYVCSYGHGCRDIGPDR
jgi:hypothetical protein